MTESLEIFKNSPQFKEVIEGLSRDKEVSLQGLVPGAKAFFLTALAETLNKNILFISPSIEEAEKTSQDIESFGGKVFNFPAWDILPKEKMLPHKDIVGEQFSILKILAEKSSSPFFLATSIKAFYHNLLSPSKFKHLLLEVKNNKESDLEKEIHVKFLKKI